jgi:hypothetical protein
LALSVSLQQIFIHREESTSVAVLAGSAMLSWQILLPRALRMGCQVGWPPAPPAAVHAGACRRRRLRKGRHHRAVVHDAAAAAAPSLRCLAPASLIRVLLLLQSLLLLCEIVQDGVQLLGKAQGRQLLGRLRG